MRGREGREVEGRWRGGGGRWSVGKARPRQAGAAPPSGRCHLAQPSPHTMHTHTHTHCPLPPPPPFQTGLGRSRLEPLLHQAGPGPRRISSAGPSLQLQRRSPSQPTGPLSPGAGPLYPGGGGRGWGGRVPRRPNPVHPLGEIHALHLPPPHIHVFTSSSIHVFMHTSIHPSIRLAAHVPKHFMTHNQPPIDRYMPRNPV